MLARDLTICPARRYGPGDRDAIMREFCSGSTTDLLARGNDVQQVSLVVNYDLPTDRENHIHRIGRGGRFGCKGAAVHMVTEGKRTLRDMETCNPSIEECPSVLLTSSERGWFASSLQPGLSRWGTEEQQEGVGEGAEGWTACHFISFVFSFH